mmetsp:Transcript_17590/g.35752  ORF Transcript_17590/g.35752 Transcript_17590/m.35752 type:complete len:367 (-) Transcript_17590:873-1973(-)
MRSTEVPYGEHDARKRACASLILRPGHLHSELEVLRSEKERRLALREVLRLRRERLLLAEEAEQLQPRLRLWHRAVEQAEEGERVLGEPGALALALHRRLQLLVLGLRFDQLLALPLDVDLAVQPLRLHLVLALLLLQPVDPVGGLLDDLLQHAGGLAVDAFVPHHLQPVQLHAALRVEGGVGRRRPRDDGVERGHERLERDAAHRLDERRPRVVPHVALRVTRSLDHARYVDHLPEDRALEQQLHIVRGAHLVLEEGVLRAQVDLLHGNLVRHLLGVAHHVRRRVLLGRSRRPVHRDQSAVRRQEESGALAAAARVSRVEGVRARVVAHDGHLVRLNAHELAHLDDLLECGGEEEPLLLHQPLLA